MLQKHSPTICFRDVQTKLILPTMSDLKISQPQRSMLIPPPTCSIYKSTAAHEQKGNLRSLGAGVSHHVTAARTSNVVRGVGGVALSWP